MHAPRYVVGKRLSTVKGAGETRQAAAEASSHLEAIGRDAWFWTGRQATLSNSSRNANRGLSESTEEHRNQKETAEKGDDGATRDPE